MAKFKKYICLSDSYKTFKKNQIYDGYLDGLKYTLIDDNGVTNDIYFSNQNIYHFLTLEDFRKKRIDEILKNKDG